MGIQFGSGGCLSELYESKRLDPRPVSCGTLPGHAVFLLRPAGGVWPGAPEPGGRRVRAVPVDGGGVAGAAGEKGVNEEENLYV